MLKAPVRRSRGRAKQKQETPVRIVSATAATNTLTVTFDQTVNLKGIPAYAVDVPSVTRTDAELTSPTTLALTFSGSIAAATTMTIRVNDPGIRSTVGGYVADTTFPV